MARTFVQTDTVADDGFDVGSSGEVAGDTIGSREILEGGSGSGTQSLAIGNDASDIERAVLGLQTDVAEPDDTSWEAGDYVVNRNITTARSGVQWRATYLMARTAGGVFTTVASLLGQTTDLGVAEVKTQTINLASAYTANATDTLYLLFVDGGQFLHGGTATTTTMGQNVVTPLDSAGLSANLGLLTETNLAQSMGKAKAKAVGLLTETDVSQSMGRAKAKEIGLQTEADLAQALQTSLEGNLGLLTEADLAQAFGKAKSKAIGLVSESELAQILGKSKALAIGLIAEADLAQSLGRDKAKVIGLISETDQVFAMTTGGLSANLGLVLETDVSQAMSKAKDKVIGLLTETDLAQAISAAKRRELGLVTELDAVFALGKTKIKTIGLLAELDVALAMSIERRVNLGLVLEADSTFVMSTAKALALGLVSETDVVFPITTAPIVIITNLVQREARFQVKLRRDGNFAQTVPRDAKF